MFFCVVFVYSDGSHSSDCLCVVELGPSSQLRRSTETKTKTMNASWDATFLFDPVELADEDFEREKISFNVYHKRDFARNLLIGIHANSSRTLATYTPFLIQNARLAYDIQIFWTFVVVI